MSYDVGLRVVSVERLNRRLYLRLADVAVVVEHLALQVGHVDGIEVHQSYCPHSGECEVYRYRRPQPSGAYDQRLCIDQFPLSDAAHLGHDDVAAVPSHLVGSQGPDRCSCHYVPPILDCSLVAP